MGEVMAAERSSNRAQMLTGALSRYGSGEGVSGALGGMGGRLGAVASKAGIVGAIGAAVVTAGKKGFDTVAEQTQKGAEWRSIYGEDAGRFAAQPRFEQFSAGVESFFQGVGSQRGKDAYAGAARIGLTGDRIDSAVEFDQEMYLKQGMSTETSMKFVEMNANNANVSLAALSKQIEEVSNSAVKAGKNSEEAIAAFANTAAMISNNVVEGAAATEISAGLTTEVTSKLPRALATETNIQALAGTLNQTSLMRYASTTGQDYAEVSTRIATGDSDLALQAIGGSAEDAARLVCTAAGTTPEELRSQIEGRFPGRNFTNSPLTDSEMQEVALGTPTPIYPEMISQIFGTRGIQVPAGQQYSMFFSILMGAFSDLAGTGGSAQGEQVARGRRSGGGESVEGADRGAAINRGGARGTYAGAESGFNDYLNFAKTTGDSDSFVEKLLQENQDGGELDNIDFENNVFQTTKGPKSLADILADEDLLKELDSGSVGVQGPDNTTIDLEKYATRSKSGVQKWMDQAMGKTATGPDPSGETTPQNTIGLTPEAARMFRLVGPSDAQIAGVPEGAKTTPFQWRG